MVTRLAGRVRCQLDYAMAVGELLIDYESGYKVDLV